MRALRRLVIRLRNTVSRGDGYEARLREEIEQHLSMQTAENLRAGWSPDEARRQAILKFGSVQEIKEDHRAERALAAVQAFFRDMRYGLRNMRLSPGFTAVALLTLALGIGANVSIFSAVNGILIARLPYANSSRLLIIQRQAGWGVTFAEARTIREQCPAFERIAVANGLNLTLTIGDGSPIRRQGAEVSGDLFPMLDAKPLLGRYLVPSDTEREAAPVAVLSYSLWRGSFGGDQRVVGREVMVGKMRYSIVGVMPERFELPVWRSDTEAEEGLWIPITDFRPGRTSAGVVGLVKEGVDLRAAKAQIRAISSRLPDRFPIGAHNPALFAETPGIYIHRDVRRGLWILQGVVALVLLLACVNLSALLIARAWSRRRELAIRKALGASRFRLVRQLLSESLVLALSGDALGLLLSIWGIRILRSIAPAGTPRLDRMRLDPAVLWFTFAISVLAAILFGLFPALRASVHRAGPAFDGGLYATFATAAAHRRRFSQSCLLIVEIGLAVILVIGAGLMGRSFYTLMRVDTGVRADHTLTMYVELSELACQPSCEAAARSVLDGINSLLGVERAALSFGGPFGGGRSEGSGIQLEGSQVARPFNGASRAATSGFFQAAGIRLLRGRDFAAAERRDVVIVSREFADRYVGGNPLGKRFSAYKDANGRPVWVEIVGVVDDTRDRNVVGQFRTDPPYYAPFFYWGRWQVIARTSTDPLSLAAPVERVIRSADKSANITNVKTLEQALYDSAALPRFYTSLFGLFGLLALFLALTGVYGVTSYSVRQRTHEIAVRMALGAQAEDVTRRVVAEGLALALVGITLGIAGALVLTRSIQSMLFQTPAVDLVTYSGVAVLLLVTASGACFFPARRATRVDPVTILRHE